MGSVDHVDAVIQPDQRLTFPLGMSASGCVTEIVRGFSGLETVRFLSYRITPNFAERVRALPSSTLGTVAQEALRHDGSGGGTRGAADAGRRKRYCALGRRGRERGRTQAVPPSLGEADAV
jgi:hypothetical protein